MSSKDLQLPSANGLSLAAAKPLSPNELSQSYTPSAAPLSPLTPKEGPSDNHIRVVCRFRPKNSKERSEEKRQNLSSTKTITVYGEGRSLEIPRGKKKPSLNFTLDNVIWCDKNQEDTFINLAKASVESMVEGYNCTIFAFGQTGSGKTWTMFGPENLGRVQDLGIIPRSVDYMFKLLNGQKNIMKYEIKLSVVEVYKEMLRDLLTTEKNNKNRKRLEILSAGKEIRVKNILEKNCDSVSAILQYIVLAQSNRAKHTTDFIGHDSSRSHCVVMIHLTQRMMDDSIKFSKLNFGDLAGSELASKTGTKGTNLKEAGKIHQGLLALENVINALVEHKKHIPYNDSKLTRLLSTSIGGNSKTTLLVTCSPSIWNRDETISTLRFARRAKKIKNVVRINKRKTREQLESRIGFLEKENATLKKKLNSKKYGGSNVVQINNKQLIEKDGEINKCLDEIIVLKDLLSKKDDALTQMEEDLEIKMSVLNEFDSTKKSYEKKIFELNNKLNESGVEISKLQGKLDTKMEMELKFSNHTQNLENIVNDSVRDSSSTMIGALTEITAQQSDFLNFLKGISDSIEQIHDKQHQTEKDINVRFDGVNDLLRDLDKMKPITLTTTPLPYGSDEDDDDESRFEPSLSNSEYDVVGHHPQSSGSLFNFGDALSSEIHSREMSTLSSITLPQNDQETLTDLILSMKTYLDKEKTEKKENKKTITSSSSSSSAEFSVGSAVDVLDVSCIWYCANISDIDAFDKRAVYVSYDDFDDAWNEWVPLNKKYRIAPHKSRTDILQINPSLKSKNGNGVHCLIATKYGRSHNAEQLQSVFSNTNYENHRLSLKSILMQGHLYKQSNWSKKTWNRRWFVVRNNENIYYYDHKNTKAKQYRGIIPLNQISLIQLAKSKGYTKHSFDIITLKNRKHRFSANNKSDLTDWLSVLECLVYSVCPQICVINNDMKNKQYIIKEEEEEDDDNTQNNNHNKAPPKRPISPRIRETLSGWFSAKPTTPRKTYTASYQAID